MKRTVWGFLLLLIAPGLWAQEKGMTDSVRSEFIISVNLAGDASVLSLGFEKLFFLKPGVILAGKVGFGFNQEFQLFDPDPPQNYFILPHHVTVNLGGGKRSFVEMGIGGSWITDNRDNYYLVYPMVGYRLHPFKIPGFSFRACLFYPFGQMSVLDTTDMWLVPLGLSVGIAL